MKRTVELPRAAWCPLTGVGFLVKALSHKSLRFRASHSPKPLHCLALLGFAREKPTPVSVVSPLLAKGLPNK